MPSIINYMITLFFLLSCDTEGNKSAKDIGGYLNSKPKPKRNNSFCVLFKIVHKLSRPI